MLYVGIDVASEKHDCAILDSETGEVCDFFVFANNRDGFEGLLSKLAKFSKTKDFSDIEIGLESTGHYSNNLVNFLHEKRLSVKVFNPLSVQRLRKAQTLRRTKTDKSDAKFLACMLVGDDSKPYEKSLPQIEELKTLTRHRFRLVKEISKHKQHISRLITIVFPEISGAFCSTSLATVRELLLQYPSAETVAVVDIRKLTSLLWKTSKHRFGREKAEELRNLARHSIGTNNRGTSFELQQHLRTVQFLKEQLAELDLQIKTIMLELDSPITSIPGISFTLGAMILAETGDIKNFANPSKLLAFAGLDPSCYQSGKFTADRTPMVKHGSSYLRYALIQAAMCVKRFAPDFNAYFNKKSAENKHYFVATSHVAKKLVRVIFSLLKYQKQYIPQTA
jgi:transposase